MDRQPSNLAVRAERNVLGKGRTYFIGIVATDTAGNSTTALHTIIVAHNRRSGLKTVFEPDADLFFFSKAV